jgi:hypothetical protein
MALQPVTYRPITEIKPVTRKEPETAKAQGRARAKKRKPDPGTGEHVDIWA